MNAERRPLDIDLSLLRVVVGYRIISALWLVILGAIALAASLRLDHPAAVIATMVGVSAWSGLTVFLSIRRTAVITSVWFLVLDVAVAVAALISSNLAGTESFSGGYPLSTVFLAIYALGTWAGVSAAGALTITAVVRTTQGGPGDLTLTTGSVIVYMFAAGAAAWAVALLRRNDLRTRLAEEALTTERTIRARAEARTEMAAHLHDSVLQTLALIQRSPDDPDRVAALARRQERDLRAWLYGAQAGEDEGLRRAVTAMAAEVEDLTGARIEVVVVGDAPPGREVDDLVAAGREAVVNAAKHSGSGAVDIYAEADAERVMLFVRDRGAGFDPATIGEDRRGITDSIVGRMTRLGGTATIRSAVGEGTEVHLEVPRRQT